MFVFHSKGMSKSTFSTITEEDVLEIEVEPFIAMLTGYAQLLMVYIDLTNKLSNRIYSFVFPYCRLNRQQYNKFYLKSLEEECLTQLSLNL